MEPYFKHDGFKYVPYKELADFLVRLDEIKEKHKMDKPYALEMPEELCLKLDDFFNCMYEFSNIDVSGLFKFRDFVEECDNLVDVYQPNNWFRFRHYLLELWDKVFHAWKYVNEYMNEHEDED